MVTYKSLDIIPVYHYYKCLNGDFKFMIVGDVNELPDIDDNQRMQLAVEFHNMSASFEGKRDSETVRLMQDHNDVECMRIINRQVQAAAFFIATNQLDAENKEALEELCSEFGLTLDFELNNKKIQRKIDKIDKRKSESETPTIDSLINNIVQLNQILNVDIDEMKCSASKYFKYNKSANDKVLAQKAQKNVRP